MSHALEQLGWDERWAAAAEAPPERVGRVIGEHRGGWTVVTSSGSATAILPGRLRAAIDEGELDKPAVGDWLVLRAEEAGGSPLRVERVVARRSQIARRAIGRAARPQVVAANLDTVFIVCALGRDLNERRIERFVAIAFDGGTDPVVVLNKVDLFGDEERARALERISAVAPGVPIYEVSALTGEGVAALSSYLHPGRTVALVGTSGAGKSTLANGWLESHAPQRTGELGVEGKGRHTTTSRELRVLPSGACVIDTPGLREVGLWSGDEGLERAFDDLTELAAGCRFSDCRHEQEPGCAIRAAVEAGDVAPERLAAFHRLQRERAFVERRSESGSQQRHKATVKIQTRALRRRLRDKRK